MSLVLLIPTLILASEPEQPPEVAASTPEIAAPITSPGCLVHTPPTSAAPGRELELRARCEEASRQHTVQQVWIYYRHIGDTTWEQAKFRRDERDDALFISSLAREVAEPPGVEYFIAANRAGDGDDVIGGPSRPIQIPVERASTAAQGRTERAALFGGQYELGSQTILQGPGGGGEFDPILRVAAYGVVHLRRPWLLPDKITVRDPGIRLETLSPIPRAHTDDVEREAYTGANPHVELGLGRVIGLEVGANIGVSQDSLGFRENLAGRVGPNPGSNLTLRWQRLPDLGYSGELRLNVATRRAWPFSAGVELTNILTPQLDEDQQRGLDDTALRLAAQVTRQMQSDALRAGGHLSWQLGLSYQIPFSDAAMVSWGGVAGASWGFGGTK